MPDTFHLTSAMRVLVIGGTGYIGSHTVEELVRRGYEVTVFARGLTPTALPDEITFITGDRHKSEDLEHARAQGFDAIIDINAYTREETQTVIKIFDGEIKRFVHLSTVAVYHLAAPMPLKEDAPLVTDPLLHYAYNKAECERALRWAYTKNQFPYVAIRPPVVFGPRDDKSRECFYLKRLFAGDPIIVPDTGANPIFAIYVKDLATILVNALQSDQATGCAYHLAQSEFVTLDQHIAAIAQIAGATADVEYLPVHLLDRFGFVVNNFPFYLGGQPILLDTHAAQRDLKFKPTPYRQALRDTIAYFLGVGVDAHNTIEDLRPLGVSRMQERALVTSYRVARQRFEDALIDDWLNGLQVTSDKQN